MRSRRPAAAVAALLVGGALAGTAMLTSAGANSTFSFTRLGGVNRFDTARIIAADTFPSGAATAIISTGYNFPDALAGNYLAGLKGAPVLLVAASGAVPSETLAALSALHTKNVIITGGTSAVGADVATALAGTTSTAPGGGNLVVSRVFGDNRYDTMVAIDETPGAPVPVNTAILATGRDFPDALSAGGIAYHSHFPIVLTDGTQPTLTPQAQKVIGDNHITHLIVTGGSAAVNPAQYTNLPGVTVDFVAGGTDRSQTSQLLADYSINHLGFSNAHFHLANGFNPATNLPPGSPAGFTPDALSGGPNSGVETAPIVLTLNPTTPGSATQFATTHASTLGTGDIFGGTAAVADSTAASITTAAGVATPTTLPPTPPLGGLGTNPNTLGPNLVSCTITADNFAAGAASTVQFLFDKPILGTTVDAGDLELDGYLVTHFAFPSTAAVDPSNPNAINANFPAGPIGDPNTYTVCTADNDAPGAGAGVANNGGGVANPLETQLLGGSVVVPGQGTGATDCPDLSTAVPTPGDGTHTKADFTFDKNITATGTPPHFAFYDGAGVIHLAVAAATSLGGNPITATFAANVTTATRFAVLFGAATNGTCVSPDGAVSPAGATAPNPNLVSVSRAAVNIFTFTYDKNVTLVPANFAHFHVYSNIGTQFTPTATAQVVQTGNTTINVTFPAVTSGSSPSIVLGTDDNVTTGTAPVTATVTALGSSIGSAPIATAASGPTNSPIPISATRDNAANNATITFNQNICNTGGCVPVAPNFYVINANNVPIAAAAVTSVSGRTLTLHWTAPGAIANGVGVGVASTVNGSEEGAFTTTGAFSLGGSPNTQGTVALS